jgi:hypothetical protein
LVAGSGRLTTAEVFALAAGMDCPRATREVVSRSLLRTNEVVIRSLLRTKGSCASLILRITGVIVVGPARAPPGRYWPPRPGSEA